MTSFIVWSIPYVKGVFILRYQCNMSLAMISVPIQEWRNIYSPEVALCRGTLFEELDLPFWGGDVE